jgi:hypothetical protein
MPYGLTASLTGKVIGVINKVGVDWCQASILDFKLKAEGQPVRGLSLRLSPSGGGQVKLIPFRRGDLKIRVGSCVEVEIV